MAVVLFKGLAAKNLKGKTLYWSCNIFILIICNAWQLELKHFECCLVRLSTQVCYLLQWNEIKYFHSRGMYERPAQVQFKLQPSHSGRPFLISLSYLTNQQTVHITDRQWLVLGALQLCNKWHVIYMSIIFNGYNVVYIRVYTILLCLYNINICLSVV